MRSLGYLAAFWLAVIVPSTVLADPLKLDELGKKVRFLSLAEARAIALENGQIGQPSRLFPGVGSDNLVTVPKGDDSSHECVHVSGKPGSKEIMLSSVRPGPRTAELERSLNQILLNIECAYWNLYGSYWQLYSREQALRFAYETWKITQAQYKVGRVSRAAVAQAEGQYDLFRSQRLAALDTVMDNERQLRVMMGMQIRDGARLVPCDSPTLVEKKPDWNKGLQATLKDRPELHTARADVDQARANLMMTEMIAFPIQCFLDAEDCAESEVANAMLQESEIKLARASLVLHDQEQKAERYLGLWHRRTSSAYSQIKAAQAQCEAFATQVGIRYELYRAGINEPGTGNPVTLNLLLEAQRFWAEALVTECQNIVTYNNALAGWAFAQGTSAITKHAHVRLADKAPADGDEVRAVVREHKRTRHQVRHEQGVSAGSPLTVLGAGDTDKAAPSLPALWKSYPPLKQVGDLKTGLVEERMIR